MDNPALRPDGTLRDASEIEWKYSPQQKIPPPPAQCPSSHVQCPPSPTPKPTRGFQFLPPIMPSQIASAQGKRKQVTDKNISIMADVKKKPEPTAMSLGTSQKKRYHSNWLQLIR
jgi:hypothetical protein